MAITGEQFKALGSVEKEILYINSQLAADPKLTVSKLLQQDLGISKSRLQKYNDYKFDQDSRQYIRKDGSAVTVKGFTLNDVQPSDIEKIGDHVKMPLHDATTYLELKEQLKIDIYNEIKTDLKYELQQIIKNNSGSSADQDQTAAPADNGININYDLFSADLITRSFRIHENILEDWTNYCNDNKKQHKAQSLLSQALYEYMNNHK